MHIVIVGAGPSGLTLALYLSKYKSAKVTLVDQNDSIGGCHRVYRDKKHNGFFSEHAPKVYNDNAVNFKQLLKNELYIDFYDLFEKITDNSIDLSGFLNVVTYKEWFHLMIAHIRRKMNKKYGKTISIADFIQKNNFSDYSKYEIDLICSFSGLKPEKYTLSDFIDFFVQNKLRLYKPRLPNDKALFNIWQYALKLKDVDILLNSKVEKIETHEKYICIKNTDPIRPIHIIQYDTLILAIPPISSNQLLSNKDLFMNEFDAYVEKTSRITFLCLSYIWDGIVDIHPRIDRDHPWGIIYTTQYDDPYTVLTVECSKLDTLFLNKTLNEISTKKKVVSSVYKALDMPSTVPDYKTGFVFDKNKHVNGSWQMLEKSFVKVLGTETMSFKSKDVNIFTVGCHTGKNSYSFNNIESAVTNAMILYTHITGEILPIKNTK